MLKILCFLPTVPNLGIWCTLHVHIPTSDWMSVQIHISNLYTLHTIKTVVTPKYMV